MRPSLGRRTGQGHGEGAAFALASPGDYKLLGAVEKMLGKPIPPLVVGPSSRIALTVDPGHGGVRHEIDGRPADLDGKLLTVRLRRAHAKLVQLEDEEPRLEWLRRRGLIADGPRVLVRDSRPDAQPL